MGEEILREGLESEESVSDSYHTEHGWRPLLPTDNEPRACLTEPARTWRQLYQAAGGQVCSNWRIPTTQPGGIFLRRELLGSEVVPSAADGMQVPR